MGKLDGKVALITGGARGIGRQIALTFAGEGADIIIVDIREMDETAEEIRNLERRVITVNTDITKKKDVESAIDAATVNFGRLDILVNNAGTSRHSPLEKMTEGDWDFVMNVNLKGAFLCTQAAVKHMMKQKYGKIINMASVAAVSSRTHSSINYQCSKAGVVHLTKAAARELGPYGINVNAIAPGLTDTDLPYSGRDREFVARWLEDTRKTTPLGRICTTQDLANLALFLASDDSSFISGQVIAVDGGRG